MRLRLKPSRELGLIGLASALTGLAIWLDRRKSDEVSVSTLRNPHAGSRNLLDAFAWDEQNAPAANLADAGLYGGPALPLLLAFHPRPRRNFGTLLLIWLETVYLNFAVTSVIKNRFSRPRPYVLAASFPFEQVLSRNDRAAFLSGHTSMAAAGGVLFALLVSHYSQNRPAQMGAFFIAGSVPGFTAFLRVKSAKHWPTDAVAGVLLGAGVALSVFELHRVENGDTGKTERVAI
ncbi:phosphatase PAP2 family protein [Neolewinella aurantiaca]|uniref:Phosphatase PAP2 family protein n=1 Tax=Neolewinella aurantiaca TaxID=2602767 RepID=A0A5C7G077_9BACT|nr:phosphatase PAP2 family protein [Neolewinella aurantiaca]TXF91480.1 phosphatase PAP2 family protein [Neolewinella aurantiaca]